MIVILGTALFFIGVFVFLALFLRKKKTPEREEILHIENSSFHFDPGQRLDIQGVGKSSGEWIVTEIHNGLEHSDLIVKRVKEVK